MKSLVITAIASALVLASGMSANANCDSSSKSESVKVHNPFHTNRKLAIQSETSQERGGNRVARPERGGLVYSGDNFIITN